MTTEEQPWGTPSTSRPLTRQGRTIKRFRPLCDLVIMTIFTVDRVQPPDRRDGAAALVVEPGNAGQLVRGSSPGNPVGGSGHLGQRVGGPQPGDRPAPERAGQHAAGHGQHH